VQLFPSTTTPGGLYPLRRLSLLIAGLYTSIAAVWIIGAAFSFSAKTAENPVQARLIKDTIFVITSGAALYFVIYRTIRRIHHSQRALDAERGLRHANEHLRSLVYSSPIAILTLMPDGNVQTWNRAAEEMFGWTEVETHGQHDPTVPPDKKEECRLQRQRVLRGERLTDIEVRRIRKDGTPIDVAVCAAPLYAGEEVASVIMFCTDITEKKQQAEKVQHLATHDPLTNLPNRRILEDHLIRVVERARRGQPGALLMLDLDSFKVINDELGHLLGDQYLIHLARVLETTLRAGDVLTRFGGDEFAMLLENVSPSEAKAIADRARASVSAYRFFHEGKSYDTSVSVGVVPIGADADTRSVMVMADTALLIAKDEGKNRVVLYEQNSQIFAKLTESSRWATRIKDALRDNRFVLHFQPVVHLATGEADHFEVLLRMRDHDGRIISPGAFLHAAERFGLTPRIDRWVVENVLNILAARKEVRIFVNLSGASLSDSGLLDFIEQKVKGAALARGRLVFEITETAAVTDLHHAQQWMSRLSDLGCEFALDDFGVAFSSFTYLRVLPVHYVKLDGSYVRNLATDPCDRAMVQALNTIAHAMGKKVIAEWVECEAVVNVLRDIGTEFGQGYYWGEPRPDPQRETIAA